MNGIESARKISNWLESVNPYNEPRNGIASASHFCKQVPKAKRTRTNVNLNYREATVSSMSGVSHSTTTSVTENDKADELNSSADSSSINDMSDSLIETFTTTDLDLAMTETPETPSSRHDLVSDTATSIPNGFPGREGSSTKGYSIERFFKDFVHSYKHGYSSRHDSRYSKNMKYYKVRK